MSRHAGQISTREAIGGILVVALGVVVIVTLATALLPREQPVPAFDGPQAEESGRPCPTPRESSRRSPPRVATEPIDVSSRQLIDCPIAFDGQPVVYEGEVVRAVLRRGARAWVQLNDDPYGVEIGPLPEHHVTAGANSGVAVSIPAADADRILHVGSGRARGDRLRVRGTFVRADPADGGGPTIQAATVDITGPGGPISSPVTPARVVVALLLVAAAAAMAWTVQRSDKR